MEDPTDAPFELDDEKCKLPVTRGDLALLIEGVRAITISLMKTELAALQGDRSLWIDRIDAVIKADAQLTEMSRQWVGKE